MATALPAFLLRQRWYPAKDAGEPAIKGCVLVPVTVPDVPAAAGVWTVQPPGRAPIHLFVALAVVPEASADVAQVIVRLPGAEDDGSGKVVVEAFSVDGFAREWVAMLLREESTGRLRSGQARQLVSAGLEPGSGASLSIRRGSAEQSNTSIRVGDGAIMKVIRKLEEGIHPELEVGRFLTGEAAFDATPAMLAWAELEGVDGAPSYTLCVMQAFVPNQGDGWDWVVRKLADAATAGDPPLAEATAWLERLGERTAQMHRAFGIGTDDPAFAAEPVQDEDLREWSQAAHAMAKRALDGLEKTGGNLPPEARACAESLRSKQEQLRAGLDGLLGRKRATDASNGPQGFCKTRHHGDYHLGQVLVAGNDAIIVDFEGEPMRPLAERRAKHAPLRDVAGLLRSLSYAAAAGARALPGGLTAEAREAASSRLQQWERSASDAFLNAYLGAAQGMASCPADRASAQQVIRFFMLEKALYEVAYELANRPDWVEIPLRGILALLEPDALGAGANADADRTRSGTASRVHRMPFGAQVEDDGSVRFRLWAPSHAGIKLELDGAGEVLPMQAADGGWHELLSRSARAGSAYRFVLPDGLRVPDPASRYQPQDVHGPSEVIDPRAHAWADTRWKGRPWEEAVVYELHVGAFTPAGTFRGAIERLDHLVSLGVTALEIMPVADFPGSRNWGYDGVLPYAPDSAYGRPEDFKALVDAAHARGLMVLLDVVYNHFGPEGAYQHAIAPETFTDRHKTPWGAAINTDGPGASTVREYFIHNALYWIEEFHLDGLRLDAVHAILDDSPRHLLSELADRVRAAAPDRHIHLVLENEENQASRLVRDESGRPRWYTGQWNDDVHHVLHVAASGESQGYYGDYQGDTSKLGRALGEGFAFQGEVMPYRGHERGEPSAQLPPTAFVAFMQNHDQVGNRAFGDRLTAFSSKEAVRAAASVYLLMPQIPMLFMGEEWAAAQPFPFFCDFGPELADAVRNGRREEFSRFPEFQDPAKREQIPDPVAEATFASAKLGWDDLASEPHAGWLEWYRKVLAVRHAEIVPRLSGIVAGGQYQVVADGAVTVRWRSSQADRELVLAANLSAESVDGFPPARGRVLWSQGETGAAAGDGGAGKDEAKPAQHLRFGPWSVRWTLEGPGGGAGGQSTESTSGTATKALTESAPQAATGPRDESPLAKLAAKMGIEPEFRNAHGNMVQTSDDTRRKLLAAMGVEATDDAQVQAALASLERADWSRALPPVQVLQSTESAEVDATATGTPVTGMRATDPRSAENQAAVTVVQAADCSELAWRLALEGGEERTGRAGWAELELLDTADLDGRKLQRRRLPLPAGLPSGYHQLAIGDATMSLIVTPGRCWLPPVLADGRRLWGVAAQLYLVRSDNDWGIGDFGDLRKLVELAAEHEADVIGLNPLHAMFQDNPEHASPYSPASRLLLNVLNIDVTSVPELADCRDAADLVASPQFQQQLAACREQRLVDYRQVSALKLPVLRKLFDAAGSAANPERRQKFDAFRQELGDVLERNCLYLALRNHFAAAQPARPDWHDWPTEYQDPGSDAVATFAREHRHDIDFLVWLQWVADEQLGAAAASATRRGMAVGLYRDLAVGSDRAGAETWANAASVVSDAQVGAPPDIFNTAGQGWGLPPFEPRALREEGYRSFIELIRANMRHAGGLRIDHVMGLQHLYWVPAGEKPSVGAYVQYPMEDMVGILALESHRHQCLVVGEDLGTVPEGFRERMAAANILSYRVLFFEKAENSDDFLPPSVYPSLALAVIGSHDLPTLRGWWEGRDLEIKDELGLFPEPEDFAKQRAARVDERKALLAALRKEGLLPIRGEPDVAALSLAAHGFLARTPSLLAMTQLDDLTDEADPVNVPATSEEHPNWRRRHSLTLEQLAERNFFKQIAGVLCDARAVPATGGEAQG